VKFGIYEFLIFPGRRQARRTRVVADAPRPLVAEPQVEREPALSTSASA
jgi:hypothetical protein